MDQPVVIDDTFGSALIGLLLGAVLYGVTLLQTWLYFRHYEKDSRILKSVVLLLWFLDTLHLALCARTIYWYLITNYNNPSALADDMWAMSLQTDCNGVIGLIVEVFFARRVYMMSRNWLITGLIVVLACIHFGLGVVFTVESFILVQFSRFPELTWITCTGLGCAAAADLLIAFTMCWYLFRSRTGFERTDSMITTLMIYSINTGLVTSIVATGAVIAFAVMPLNFVWLAFFWVLGKCYVNSLLAILNSRDVIREKASAEPGSFVQMSTIRPHPEDHTPTRRSSLVRKVPTALTVQVQTTTEYKSDYPNSPNSQTSKISFSPTRTTDIEEYKRSDSMPSFESTPPLPVTFPRSPGLHAKFDV
ncbi:hypothetical protein DENSPDRAFT_928362 [Dentipellis sp. KUC8613]|nr:hypothetical protein DENSPDRAFT_928362 [Dentipellis sp. KUC8613]